MKTALEVRERLKKEGVACGLVNLRFAKPLDEQMLLHVAGTYQLAVTMEENIKTGGLGEAVCAYLRGAAAEISVIQVAIDNQFLPHGNVEVLKREAGLDAESITKQILRSRTAVRT